MKLRSRRHRKFVVAAAAATAAAAPALFAPVDAHAAAVVTTATWTASTGGSLLWNLGSNWSSDPDYPSGVGAGAIIGGAPATRTINLGEAITVGSIAQTDSTNFSGTIAAGGGSLTWDATDAGPATISVDGTGTGQLTLSAPSTLNDNIVATVNQTSASSAAGSLNWTGTISGGGGFTKEGPGLMTFGTGTKTYTGPTLFDTNGGRTRISSTARPQNSSSVTIKDGAQVECITTGSYSFGGPLNLNGFGLAAFPGSIRPTRDMSPDFSSPTVIQSDTVVHEQSTGQDGANGTGTMSFSGQISGPGHLQLTASGSDNQIGRYYFGAANTMTGGVSIIAGTLNVVDGAGLGTGPIEVSGNVSQPINTVMNLNFTGAAPATSSGSLSGVVQPGSTATIKLNGTTYTVKQTADGSYAGAMVDGTASPGSFGLDAASNHTLTMTGNLTYTGATSVAGGHLALATNLTATSGVAVSGGTLELVGGGGNNRVIQTPSISVTGTGRLDIQDNKLITKTPVGTASGGIYSDVSRMIQTGRNGGGWGGSGIVTSQSQATTGSLTSIGVATAQQVKGLTNPTDTAIFAGRTVTGSDTLVMYTYGGDANLDGKINVDDYGRIDLNSPLPGVSGWYNGDFNYDGKINVDDYGIIDFNVGIQGSQFPSGAGGGVSGVSAVPEPATASLLVLAGAAAMNRRSRRRKA